MNGMSYTSGYIGAIGEYPIIDYINLIVLDPAIADALPTQVELV